MSEIAIAEIDSLMEQKETPNRDEGNGEANAMQDENGGKEKQPCKSKEPIFLNSSLAFKMGLISLAKFGVLPDFLEWVRS